MAAIFSLQLMTCLNNILRIRHVLGRRCVVRFFRTKICYKTLCETSHWAVRVVEFSDLFINLYGGSNPDRAHFFISFYKIQ